MSIPKNDAEQLAIIDHPVFGYDPDTRQVRLNMTVFITEGTCAGISLTVGQALDMLTRMEIPDVNMLDGKPVWIRTVSGLATYARPFDRPYTRRVTRI